jgi:hypothetical protein
MVPVIYFTMRQCEGFIVSHPMWRHGLDSSLAIDAWQLLAASLVSKFTA